MNIGDKLRQEMGTNMLPDWFAEQTISEIKRKGRVTYICARHIQGVSRGAFPLKYEHAIYEWARENGFNAEPYANGYGVPGIRITL